MPRAHPAHPNQTVATVEESALALVTSSLEQDRLEQAQPRDPSSLASRDSSLEMGIIEDRQPLTSQIDLLLKPCGDPNSTQAAYP
jgi:hypothetical protein